MTSPSKINNERLVLIDVLNYLHRAYHALPKTFKNKEGEPINAVYGFASMLISTIDILRPAYIIAAWDDKDEETFRAIKFTGYKAHRTETEEDLSSQLPKAREILEGFGIPSICVPGYEADDVIGTLAKQCSRYFSKTLSVVIVTNDRDMLQLVDENIRVFIPKGGKMRGLLYGPSEVRKKYGFDPEQLVDYKALRGDPSDNIPGVRGIGDKTAKDLLFKYKSIEEIYENIKEVSPRSVQEKLASDPEIAVMSKDLAEIRTDVPIKIDLHKSRFKQLDKLKAIEVLKRYNFKSLIKRLEGNNGDKNRRGGRQKVAAGQESLL